MDVNRSGRRSAEKIRETGQTCLLLLLISIQWNLEEAVSSLALIRACLHTSHTGSLC